MVINLRYDEDVEILVIISIVWVFECIVGEEKSFINLWRVILLLVKL